MTHSEQEEILRRALNGTSVDYSAMVGNSALARLHVVVHGEPGHPLAHPDPLALQVLDGVGHLCMAFTAEPDRRRGAQQALIARRIEQATALGCITLVSETLSFLKSSLGNLRRAGFAPACDKEVYNSRPES